MPDPIWPITVPSEPLQGSYAEKFTPKLSIFQPDVGPPTTLRKTTLRSAALECSFRMTGAELDLFLDFFHEDLEGGALTFVWTNPVYGQPLRYRFDPASPPQWEARGAGTGGITFHVRAAMFRLGGEIGGEVIVDPVWILATGYWDDEGIWIDEDIWNDGPFVTDEWLVADGFWWDDGVWVDDEEWTG
jgi:hypothetical protein